VIHPTAPRCSITSPSDDPGVVSTTGDLLVGVSRTFNEVISGCP
jgi:hypothetical protein